MACIGCGLRQRSDGKGTLDIDTVGGLECNGDGVESDGNGSGRGIRIKKNGTSDNAILVDANGLYVPRASNFGTHFNTVLGTNVTDPNYPAGLAYTGTTVSIDLPSNPYNARDYAWQACLDWSVNNSSVPWHMELHCQVNGGGWQPYASILLNESVVSPVVSRIQTQTVDAGGKPVRIDARVIIYTGHVGAWRVSLSAWGDYTGGAAVPSIWG